jgi:hypothetical protein
LLREQRGVAAQHSRRFTHSPATRRERSWTLAGARRNQRLAGGIECNHFQHNAQLRRQGFYQGYRDAMRCALTLRCTSTGLPKSVAARSTPPGASSANTAGGIESITQSRQRRNRHRWPEG